MTVTSDASCNNPSACDYLRPLTLTVCSHSSRIRIIIFLMPPYDDWNKIDDEEDEELQDASVCFDL